MVFGADPKWRVRCPPAVSSCIHFVSCLLEDTAGFVIAPIWHADDNSSSCPYVFATHFCADVCLPLPPFFFFCDENRDAGSTSPKRSLISLAPPRSLRFSGWASWQRTGDTPRCEKSKVTCTSSDPESCLSIPLLWIMTGLVQTLVARYVACKPFVSCQLALGLCWNRVHRARQRADGSQQHPLGAVASN